MVDMIGCLSTFQQIRPSGTREGLMRYAYASPSLLSKYSDIALPPSLNRPSVRNIIDPFLDYCSGAQQRSSNAPGAKLGFAILGLQIRTEPHAIPATAI